MDTLTVALHAATARLKGNDDPRLEAELLLAHALGSDRSYLRAHPDATLDATQTQSYAGLLAARARGEPIAYITGKREFWSLDLAVTPATLIPRPETELLVEQALALIPTDEVWEVLDLGTGSGAIALALAKERPSCRVVATDLGAEALGVAQQNAARLGISNLEFLQGDWYGPVTTRRFRLIVSNPPYIGLSDPHLTQGDLRFEPRQALASGAEGLDDLRRIVAGAPTHLDAGADLMLEHGYAQGPQVRELLQAAGFSQVQSIHDLGGHERVSRGHWANAR